jgi:hypothetical protein
VWHRIPPRWRQRWRAWTNELLQDAADRRGYDLVARSPYSPVPAVPPADSPEWGPKHSLVGLAFDSGVQLDWLRCHLTPYLGELAGALERPEGGNGFFLKNGYYAGLDAVLLHAMVRHLKPRRVIEVGAGYSTLVLAGACERNAAFGSPCELVSIDPEPRCELPERLPGLARVDHRSATEVPLGEYLALGPGDILFVDSSHTVKRGSEVNFLVLEVLPRLRRGVVVHFHDVFLPFDYPREWFVRGTFLAEQYLLHAFLVHNPTYEVIFAAHAVARDHFDMLQAIVPCLSPGPPGPAALWLRRCA